MFSFRNRSEGTVSGAMWSRLGFVVAAGVATFIVMTAAVRAAAPPQGERPGPEVSNAAKAFLQFVSTASESSLRAAPGLKPPVVSKIMAHRSAGKKFNNVHEFKLATGITAVELEQAMRPYQEADDLRQMDAQRKPVASPGAAGKAGGRLTRDRQAAGDPNSREQGAITQSGEGPIGNVRPGYYAKLPGFEHLDQIDPLKRTEFLETVNREMCTCGCTGETIAFCLVNDPGCPVVKARAKKIYDDIVNKPPR